MKVSAIRKIEANDKRRSQSVRHFSMAARGRMSWADWFYLNISRRTA